MHITRAGAAIVCFLTRFFLLVFRVGLFGEHGPVRSRISRAVRSCEIRRRFRASPREREDRELVVSGAFQGARCWNRIDVAPCRGWRMPWRSHRKRTTGKGPISPSASSAARCSNGGSRSSRSSRRLGKARLESAGCVPRLRFTVGRIWDRRAAAAHGGKAPETFDSSSPFPSALGSGVRNCWVASARDPIARRAFAGRTTDANGASGVRRAAGTARYRMLLPRTRPLGFEGCYCGGSMMREAGSPSWPRPADVHSSRMRPSRERTS